MKKLIIGGLSFAVLGMIALACKKTPITKEASATEDNAVLKSGIPYTTDGQMLIFTSVTDYEKSVNEISSESEKLLVNNVLALSYTSYTEELINQGAGATDLIGDNVLSALLNKDRVFQVGNYLYKVNMQLDKVFVLPASKKATAYQDLVNENKNNADIRRFSTAEDVIYLAESGDPGEKCGGIDGGSYPCYSSIINSLAVATVSSDTWRLNPGVKFFRAGVYHRLSALYEIWATSGSATGGKVNNLNSLFSVEIEVKSPQGWYKRRPCNSGTTGTTSGTFINSTAAEYQKTFYSGTRNLNGYYFFVRGRVKYPNGTYSAWTTYGGRNINSPY